MATHQFVLLMIVCSMWIWLPLATGLYVVGSRRFSGRGCAIFIVLELIAIAVSMWAMSFVARE